MSKYTFEDIEILRQKSGISYEEAVNLLEYHNGSLARALVDLEKNGVEVTTIVDMNPERRFIPTLDPGYVYQQTKKLDKTGADGIFVSCTALDCMGVIRYMEEDFGLPVVTSNQTAIWLMGSYFGRHSDHAMEYLGRLFTLPCPL